jgi:hypothetical protein
LEQVQLEPGFSLADVASPPGEVVAIEDPASGGPTAALKSLRSFFSPRFGLTDETWNGFKYLRAAILENEGFDIRITSGRRTYEQQAALYAAGRGAPGPVVTFARPGTSPHERGEAFDIAVLADGFRSDDPDLLYAAGQYAPYVGLTWGGDFGTIYDDDHFELSAE